MANPRSETRLSVDEPVIDAKHLDIETVRQGAARARATHYEATTAEEKRMDRKVNRKLDFIVLALLAIEFIFCGIDKTNVGFVATSSFVEDANLKPDDIPDSLSLFSATYVPFQPIMVILGRRVGVKYFIAFQLVSWGGLCMAHAGIKNSGGLIALRLLLGAMEAGFTQLAIYYLSTLYPKYSLAKRAGIFTGMYSVAGAFAGLLAYGILQLETRNTRPWQLVFLIEGGFTVLLGLLSLVFLPKSLSTAWFLTAEEKLHAVRRMEIDLAGTQEAADSNDKSVTRRDITDVLKDWKKLLTIVFNITTVFPVTAFTTFLPLVVQGMGYEGIDASLMSVSPFVVGVAGLLCFVWSSDHFRERSIHTVVGVAVGLVGVIVMAASTDNKLRYGFTHVCLSGIFVGGPLIAVWLANNTPWKGSRSVILGCNGFSNLAGVIAGQVYKSKYAPRYQTPLYVTMGIMAFGAAGLLFVRFMYMLENKKRAKEIENWTDEDFAAEATSEKRRGDQRHTFMYGF